MDKINHAKKARTLFLNGYNCSQAVFCAFCDVTGIDEKTALILSSGFGGGMGRLREVCGAVSGMNMVISALYGYDEPKNNEKKAQLYSYVQRCSYKFAEKNGSYICHELLGLKKGENNGFIPTPRDENFYKKRPCPDLIEYAAAVLDEFLIKMEQKESN